EGHLSAVPEGVGVVGAVVDGGDERQALPVEGVPPVDLGEQAVGGAEVVVGAGDGRVAGLGCAFGADFLAGQLLGVLGVVDGAVGFAGGRRLFFGALVGLGGLVGDGDVDACGAVPLVGVQRRLGAASSGCVRRLGEVLKEVGRNCTTTGHSVHHATVT